jgi:REP element-mobilizing transposase RayT
MLLRGGKAMAHLAGRIYHVYNRGCNRERIFVSDDNYRYLLRQVKLFLSDAAVSIIAYCLMLNHYHFLLRSESDNAVGRFIQRLFNSYAQAFNRQQGRSGTLFEGRAKSLEVTDEQYAIHLCRYIHLNPVVAGLARQPEDWPYSNYLEWIGQRAGTLIDCDFVQFYYPVPGEYQVFIHSSVDEAIAGKLERYCTG